MNNQDMTSIRKYITSLIIEAGKIHEKYFFKDAIAIENKQDTEIVTKADIEVDTFLRDNISKQYPSHIFLTEETAPEEYLSMKEKENVWIIDPLDGTINFSRQNPYFAISIALVTYGKPILGVMYSPITKDLYWAQESETVAYVNNKAMQVSKIDRLQHATIATDWPHKLEKRKIVAKLIDSTSQNVRQVRIQGSAVLDFAGIAAGKMDAYFHPGLKPWDVAAAALLIEKTGGKITTIEGSEWNIFTPGPLVTNGLLHQKLLELLNK